VLARWAGWGALAHAFDEGDAAGRRLRAELTELLEPSELASARRSTLNAHYTDAGIATATWRLTTALGFDGGRVLEPGCGTGVFLATRPRHLAIEATGVEVEPTTAQIAALLHPDDDIRSEGFEATRLPDAMDLVIGNVPFAKVALHDPIHNRGRHSIHNHFLIKSLALTRPGGVLVAITSRFTLDSRNPSARRELETLADFVGAVRLPSTAHRAAAGTDVVTDIVVFRRREDGDSPRHAGPWLATSTADIDGGARPVNEWFAAEPSLVVGRLVAGNGVYGREDLSVDLDAPLQPTLHTALDHLAALAHNHGLAYRPRSHSPAARPAHTTPRGGVPAGAKEGSIHRAGSGFVRVIDGAPQPLQPSPRKDAAELGALCDLRDTTVALLDAQAHHVDDGRHVELQAELNDRYDRYTRRFGPLNRFRLVRTGRTDAVTGADLYRRLNPPMGGFDDDPDFRTILALEDFDPDSQTATKAAIFTRRLLAPAATRHGADNADDALAISLDETGRVDLDRIAALLDLTPDEARAQLADRVYRDPTTNALVPAEQYLSGDVRARLDAARAAAESDAAFTANVEALERVVPTDLTPAEIDARLGAPWIPAADVEAFCTDLLGSDGVEVEHAPLTATWAIAATTWSRRTVAATSEWGTARADAIALIEASLNQRPATVYDTLEDGTRVVNPAETIAAREKQEAIDVRFAEWLWSDQQRADRLAGVYNRTFNATVTARYDGSHLTLPGLSAAFTPHGHQRDAVWRVVSTGNTLLAHAVGAGKTATMVIAAMEQRRLGLVDKPAFVVPNHMLDQFARELLQLYPSARVLVASREDASPAGRKSFVARCATGSWDAVVLTHSSFERIPLAAGTRAEFMAERMEQFRAAIAESAAGKGLTVKRLEATLARLEARHQELAAAHKKDDGATFEQTGIDFVFIDEAHAFKNKAFPTRI
jgi:N12 class adenine-specific DNA methylase